jgi:hypothetical protein
MVAALEWWKEGDKQREYYIQSHFICSPSEDMKEQMQHLPQPLLCCHNSFASNLEYEAHYELTHQHQCASCHIPWINQRILSIHETEQHDVFFKLKQEKEATTFHGYKCLIARCDRQFTSEKTRKRHMIDAHRFPFNFPFNFIKTARDKKRKTGKILKKKQ